MSGYEPGIGDVVGLPDGDVGEVTEINASQSVAVRVITDESPRKGQTTWYNRAHLTPIEFHRVNL